MKEFEDTARRIVETVLGVPVIQFDHNTGRSIPDLRIEFPGRLPGFVEVVSDTDRHWQQMYHHLQRGNRELHVPGLVYDWWVGPTPRARLDKLLARLPDLLARLEEADETFEHRRESTTGLQRRMRASRFSAEFDELGIAEIVAGAQAKGDHGAVRFLVPGAGGPAQLDLDRVVQWCSEFLASPAIADVRDKLAATGAPQRHAFILVTMSSEWAVHHALGIGAHGVLPNRPPVLPPEITHVWLLGIEGADRCIAWLPELGGWIDYSTGPWHSAQPTGTT